MAETIGELKTGVGEAGSLEAFGYKQELKRALSFWDLIVFGLIFISPTAPMAVFGSVYNHAHGMPSLVYLIGLVAMLFTALSYRTMARAFPVAGSAYAFATRGIGVSVGFFAGWAMLLDYVMVPTLAYVFAAAALNAMFPDLPRWVALMGFIVVVTITNVLGVEATSRFNKLMLWVQLLVLAAFVVMAVIGITHGVAGAKVSTAPLFQKGFVTPPLLFGALSIAALSFLGFDGISTLSEEAKGGSSAVGRATILCLCIAAVLFVLQTWLASLFVLGKPAFAGGDASDHAFVDISAIVGGQWLKFGCAVLCIALGSAACALAGQAACARLIFGMARDGKLPRFLAHVSGKRRSPERATLIIAAITVVVGLLALDQLELLSTLVNFGAMTGFLLVHVAVLWHFGLKPGRNWFEHVLSPILGFAIIAYVVWNMDEKAQLLGAAWLVIGLVVLLILKLRKQPLEALPEA
ncbi:MAG TPA: APC family permease [Caulobacteraceae bacterium]|jgi:amino acid transporter|nr:APC family permease [Caulobacteraceae bacterium]